MAVEADETPEDVTEYLPPGEAGDTLRGLVMGAIDPAKVDRETWCQASNLSGGQVCIREECRYNTGTVFYTVDGDRLRAVSVDEDGTECWAASPPEALNWLRDAMQSPEQLTPVHRSATPFDDQREGPTDGQ